jgi:hypothetical protein
MGGDTGGLREKVEVRSQKYEVRSQKYEVRCKKD